MSYSYPKLRLLKCQAPLISETPKRPYDGENYSREILAEWIEQQLREAMTLCLTQQPSTARDSTNRQVPAPGELGPG